MKGELLLVFLAWVLANVVFVRWRTRRMVRTDGNLDALHDWAIQVFVRGSSLAFLVLLFVIAE